MGAYRFDTLMASESIATAGTKTLDIDTSEIISRITIRTRTTNNGSTPTAHPAIQLTKIEIVDGADVLYSLSGKECVAVNLFETGKTPFGINEYEDNIGSGCQFMIHFGRELWDPLLALDPKRFKNLQLKITHNLAAGGSAPDAGTMAVFADLFDDYQPSPRGFLMTKEHYSYTLVASAHEYVDLPLDYDLRMLLAMSHSASNSPSSQFYSFKLDVDNNRKVIIPAERGYDQIKVWNQDFPVNEHFAGLGSGSAVAYYIISAYENYGVGVGRSAAGAGIIVAQPSGSAINITNDSSESFSVFCTGYCPFGATIIPISTLNDPATYLSPGGMKKLRLDITANSGASGTVQVITQQMRTY